jgi:co-chaperonin GroES (HSP10)
VSETEKTTWAKVIFLKQTGSKEEASMKVVNIKTGDVVFAYAVHKRNSVHGKQSSAEACAKHLKEIVR